MDKDTIDINAEYERIFGSSTKQMLFDEEEYALLRKEIDEYGSSLEVYDKLPELFTSLQMEYSYLPLPFEGLYIPSSFEIYLDKNIAVYQEAGFKLFFVEKKQDNIVVARAAAYFNLQNDTFFVIGGSFCKETGYTQRIFETELYDYSKYFDCDNGFYFQRSINAYESPDLVAKLFIGEKATIKDWVNKDGLSLDRVYSYFRNQEIKDIEKQDTTEGNARILSTIISTLLNRSKKDAQHFFYIKRDDCEAKGYFNPNDGYFYICEGSRVSFIGEIDNRREIFLNNFCKNFTVFKQTQCISASEAAYYVTGRKLTHTVWRDKNNRYLTNYYHKEMILCDWND